MKYSWEWHKASFRLIKKKSDQVQESYFNVKSRSDLRLWQVCYPGFKYTHCAYAFSSMGLKEKKYMANKKKFCVILLWCVQTCNSGSCSSTYPLVLLLTWLWWFPLQSGFDVIHALIPSLSQNPNAKVSKAAMLQKSKLFV